MKLDDADFTDAALQGTQFWSASLAGADYQPREGTLPVVRGMAKADDLRDLTYDDDPRGLIELRKAFKDRGYLYQERQITFAIERHTTDQACHRGFGQFECWTKRILFEWTSGYELYPGRPLIVVLIIGAVCSLIYSAALFHRRKPRIWRVWNKDRVDAADDSRDAPEWLGPGPAALLYGPYFSLLSIFSIGWRELDVGNWIARIRPGEYSLRATGWVRTVSGIQSVLSVYLIALSILTYFGTPFE